MRYLTVLILSFIINNSFAQIRIDPKFVSVDNAACDSIRFSIYNDIIDSLLGVQKPHSLLIVFNKQSDYFTVSDQNVYKVAKYATDVDSSIVAKFKEGIRKKYKYISDVIIADNESVVQSNVEKMEYQSTYGPSRFFIELLEPIETWES